MWFSVAVTWFPQTAIPTYLLTADVAAMIKCDSCILYRLNRCDLFSSQKLDTLVLGENGMARCLSNLSVHSGWTSSKKAYTDSLTDAVHVLTGVCYIIILNFIVRHCCLQKNRLLHCVSKKVPTFKLFAALSNLNRFSKLLHCWKMYEICHKTVGHYPPLLRQLATLPWKIKIQIFLDIQQIWKKMQTNSILSTLILIFLCM